MLQIVRTKEYDCTKSFRFKLLKCLSFCIFSIFAFCFFFVCSFQMPCTQLFDSGFTSNDKKNEWHQCASIPQCPLPITPVISFPCQQIMIRQNGMWLRSRGKGGLHATMHYFSVCQACRPVCRWERGCGGSVWVICPGSRWELWHGQVPGCK